MARDAVGFFDGMDKGGLLADRRTQSATLVAGWLEVGGEVDMGAVERLAGARSAPLIPRGATSLVFPCPRTASQRST